jgi:hypothetical protein
VFSEQIAIYNRIRKPDGPQHGDIIDCAGATIEDFHSRVTNLLPFSSNFQQMVLEP